VVAISRFFRANCNASLDIFFSFCLQYAAAEAQATLEAKYGEKFSKQALKEHKRIIFHIKS
jgi:hypothetical protein